MILYSRFAVFRRRVNREKMKYFAIVEVTKFNLKDPLVQSKRETYRGEVKSLWVDAEKDVRAAMETATKVIEQSGAQAISCKDKDVHMLVGVTKEGRHQTFIRFRIDRQ